MLDLMNVLSVVSALAPGAQRTTSANGASIDATSVNSGNNGVMFEVQAGTITDGTHTFSLQDSIDGGNSWNAVASPYLQTPSAQSSNAFTSATVSGAILRFGYLGNANVGTISNSANPTTNKLLVRLVDTVTGSPGTGGYYSAVAILGLPFNAPAA